MARRIMFSGSIAGHPLGYGGNTWAFLRGVPRELIPAIRQVRATYTTREREMDPDLVQRLGLFEYLRARLAVAGTPEDCLARASAAVAAGARRLMFTVSLAADSVRTVELFGRRVLPALRRGEQP